MDKIYSECLQAKRTRHRVVKHDERRGQLSARRIAPTGWSMKSLVVRSSICVGKIAIHSLHVDMSCSMSTSVSKNIKKYHSCIFWD